ncbi:MAG: DNA polymerase III subunit alpha [Zetaproteobacteria bacterium]|nr:MAG: DNA polymerase III subunit alpha [Zetaproteobacteria bacterium]
MRFSPFVHLHMHTDLSLLGSTIKIGKALEKVAEMRQPALAITDYGNLFGAIEFYSRAMAMGIKPILGCEIFLCDDMRQRVSTGPRAPRFAQLVLLARNNHGWKNLLKIVSAGYLEGFYYKPRIDKAFLAAHAEGLIALSSGWNGEIEQLLQQGKRSEARTAAIALRDMFRKNCFFLELQRHNRPAQEEINRALIELAHELDIPLVATNAAHFLDRADFNPFKAVCALQQNRTLKDDVTGHFTPEHHLKSYTEMRDLFADIPEAIENTMHIANRCNVDLRFGQYQLPDFTPPAGLDLKSYMRQQAHAGLDERWPLIVQGRPDARREEYLERLNYELDIIEKMGFPGYFLIVSDFIQWAKRHQIPVGPGRGSGAGSLVAYCLSITDLDPLRYGLLFERFLNPERVSMPDFDVDFCMNRREEVIDYVTRKYGENKVAQIITFGSMKAKAVVRDVGRVMDMDLGKVNVIAKLIPNDLKMTLDKALEAEPRLEKLCKTDPEVKRLFDLARPLEGCHRNAGKHAAGVIIGRDDLVETAPLYKVPGEEGKVVQWDMAHVEKVGLIKFDFLGLKTLTVIDIACRLIRRDHPEFDIRSIPLDDQATFALLQKGQTSAVFQVESSGMRDLLTRLKPDCFEDIIALVALYRPGPLESGMVDTFIECKHGRQPIQYPLPQLKPILSETNGVILYQEQVMQIAQELAGYTLGQADLLRRAMGKKKPEEMAKQREIFMRGCKERNIPADKAEQIFDLMEKFAGYGFNKSHSAAYALIAYQTAYLKAHFPQAFMAATCSCDMGNSDKIAMLVNDCRQMGLTILPPDINASDWEFQPEGEAIRFGLGAIKGVGEKAMREIVAEREAHGPFESFEDLILRAPDRTLNKRILEALIKAGALNALIPHPRAALQSLPALLERLQKKKREFSSQQSALFSSMDNEDDQGFIDVEPWNTAECLTAEREALGFFLTGHPLEAYLKHLSGLGTCHLGTLAELEHDTPVTLPASIQSVRPYRGKRGTMAFVKIEDLHGQTEMLCFSELYERIADKLQDDTPVLIYGRVDKSRDEPVIRAEDVALLDEVLPDLVYEIRVDSSSIAWDAQTIAAIKALCTGGPARLKLRVHLPKGAVAVLITEPCIRWDQATRKILHKHFNAGEIHLQCHAWQPSSAADMRKQA